MKTRIIAGIGAGLCVLALLFKGPLWLITLVVLIASLIAYVEFDRMFFPTRSVSRQIGMGVSSFDAACDAKRFAHAFLFLVFSFIVICVAHVLTCSKEADFKKTVRSLNLELSGYIYVLALFGFLSPLPSPLMAGNTGYYSL